MLENLENKIYESVSKNRVWGLGLIPAALILDTKKFIKVDNIKYIGDIIGCYFWSGSLELVKNGVYYLLYEIGKKLI